LVKSTSSAGGAGHGSLDTRDPPDRLREQLVAEDRERVPALGVVSETGERKFDRRRLPVETAVVREWRVRDPPRDGHRLEARDCRFHGGLV
jgi:hypothetical protein